ncbi:MAG: 50S ribosomal protein L35 [Candidatus Ratteibacteria bacterium]|jgi:large subunit ribosomal protein L35
MPKNKTRKSAAKRLKRTGSGKVKRAQAYASHLLSSKSRKQKARLRKTVLVAGSDAKSIRRLMPYA